MMQQHWWQRLWQQQKLVNSNWQQHWQQQQSLGTSSSW
jgi:hypothetical protein